MTNAIHYISLFFVLSGILCLIVILGHIFFHHRQSMKIMEAVWPLTGLWASWIGLWAYRSLGRKSSQKSMMSMDTPDMNRSNMNKPDMQMPRHRQWKSIVLSTLHCGAGCTLADLIGESFTSFYPVSIGGSFLAGQWTLDYILALLFGIYFQYAAIRPMEKLPRWQIVRKAFKIDFFSLTAWQIGMYGWMAILMFGIFRNSPLSHHSWEFWFMMQIAMFFGFLTSYPANWILLKLGIKKGM